MVIYYWGRWRGTETLLWHPKGGHVKPEEALPAGVIELVRTTKAARIWVSGHETWTVVPALTGGGVFVASVRLSLPQMRRLARERFKLLPDLDRLLGLEGK